MRELDHIGMHLQARGHLLLKGPLSILMLQG